MSTASWFIYPRENSWIVYKQPKTKYFDDSLPESRLFEVDTPAFGLAVVSSESQCALRLLQELNSAAMPVMIRGQGREQNEQEALRACRPSGFADCRQEIGSGRCPAGGLQPPT